MGLVGRRDHMTKRFKEPTTPTKPKIPDVATMINDRLDEHPEVRAVLEIAAQARFMEQHAQPVELDMASDTTLTPTLSQLPGL
jgi:hypothetical protein